MGSESMSEFKTQAVVEADGSVTVQGLPFRAGEPVEVTVTPAAPAPAVGATSLVGSVIRYDDPTRPVGDDEWETVR
jgi:hypothetical protein